MQPVCFISVGHAGRTPPDFGSSYEGFRELDGIRIYVDAMAKRLREMGWRAEIREGKYAVAKTEANAAGAIVYVNAHINAGMGGRTEPSAQRGEIFYDYQTRPQNGMALAASIAESLHTGVGHPVYPKPCRPDTNGVPRDGDYAEAYGCIRGVAAPAVCTEPFFLDGAGRASLRSPDGLARIGVLIADGIHAWAFTTGRIS